MRPARTRPGPWGRALAVLRCLEYFSTTRTVNDDEPRHEGDQIHSASFNRFKPLSPKSSGIADLQLYALKGSILLRGNLSASAGRWVHFPTKNAAAAMDGVD